jgi:hypothetical protein
VGEALTDRERVLSNETRVSTMAEDEETEELRRELAEKDALIHTLEAENAALNWRLEVMELEKRSSQSGEAVMWAELPKELLGMVMEKLQPPGRVSPLAGGDWGGFEGSKHVRMVCSGWRNSHDALVTRLTVRYMTTDEGMWLLVRRFPAVVSLEVKGADYYHRAVLTDEGTRALSSLTGLTALSLSLCKKVTDEGLQTLSSLTALSTLTLYGCTNLTAEGKQALGTALPNLTIKG